MSAEKKRSEGVGILEELGLYRVRRLTSDICLTRARYLRRGIRHERYDGKLLDYAKYYANWYAWVSAKYVAKEEQAAK